MLIQKVLFLYAASATMGHDDHGGLVMAHLQGNFSGQLIETIGEQGVCAGREEPLEVREHHRVESGVVVGLGPQRYALV